MKRIIASFACAIINQDWGTIRNINVLETREIQFRCNCIDGVERWNTMSISSFESEFNINTLDFLTEDDIAKFI